MQKSSQDNSNRPIIATLTGKVAGIRDERTGQCRFLGIPYAEPPLGALRFKPTVAKSPWPGVLDASRFGFSAPQVFDSTEGNYEEFMDTQPGEQQKDWVGYEDCLTLNVWTPAPDDKKRPVLVWIHGGANWLESSRLATYHGDCLVERGDVVFVSLNYRLGIFGWLDMSVIGGAAYEGSHSNGLHDQITALQWIRKNIGAFGGDADNITVMGESAGSMDLSWLLTSGHLDGIARRVVMMSGVAGLQGLSGGLKTGFSGEHAQEKARAFLAKMSIDGMETLQAMSTEQVMNRLTAVAKISDTLFEMDSLFCQAYVHPGFTPLDPFRAAKQGGSRGIDVMIGYTGYEMGLWLFWDEALDQHPCKWSAERVKDIGSGLADEAAALYDKVFAHDAPGSRGMHLLGDSIFVMPSMWFADEISRHHQKVWMYQFDWKTDERRRALHAADQTFLFNKHETHAGKSLLGTPRDAADKAARARLTAAMQDAVLAYVRHGDPNRHANKDLSSWPLYTPAERQVMSFDTECRIVKDPAGLRREWWYEKVYKPALGG
jgi:para-nitrobenzyl esterase